MKKSSLALTALGDPTRQEIVQILSKGPMAVGEIAARLPVSRPAVSKHLRILSEAGLVESSASGVSNIYRLKEDGLLGVRDYLDGLWDKALQRYKLLAENTED